MQLPLVYFIVSDVYCFIISKYITPFYSSRNSASMFKMEKKKISVDIDGEQTSGSFFCWKKLTIYY
jgi:hypothetical protein